VYFVELKKQVGGTCPMKKKVVYEFYEEEAYQAKKLIKL